MTRRPLLALPLALALWPAAAAQAQEGPSFDCSYAETRTEVAICTIPELAQLERRMADSYEVLVGVLGEGEARRIADELLLRRQACEGDPRCVAERLLISMEVFEQRAQRAALPEVVSIEPIAPLPERDGVSSTLVVPDDTAALEELESGVPLAAQAPLPDLELTPVAPEAVAEGVDLGEVLEGAELASSDNAPEGEAAFDTPLSWAFMDLERTERAAIQARLAAVGVHEGVTDGTWSNGTLSALEAFAEEEGSGSFDLTTQDGAALLLDYIGSEAFATAFGLEATAADTAPLDPIDGTDW